MTRVAIIGAANAGKSSITNALVGEKVSIVTDLAGTTRDAITGYVMPANTHRGSAPFAVIDTAGMLKGATMLDRHMRKGISHAVQSADVILYVLDVTRFGRDDIQKIENYRGVDETQRASGDATKNRVAGVPVVVAVNKIDRVKPDALMHQLNSLRPLDFVRAVVPVSAKSGAGMDTLLEILSGLGGGDTEKTPDPDTYTDQTVRKMACEIIRGAVIKNTRDEIPHGIAVVITKFAETPNETEIYADILCTRPNHKAIIIGRGGENLKKIGTNARQEIEKLTDTHVKLFTHVIVREDWKNDPEIFS